MGEGRRPFGHDGFQERAAAYPMVHASAGENVAMSGGTGGALVAEMAVDGWVKSPGHRRNLLSNWEYCGIGVYQNGNGQFYLTQLFAG